jgi:hypothetical protein
MANEKQNKLESEDQKRRNKPPTVEEAFTQTLNIVVETNKDRGEEEESSLICNIPEHHKLEDLVHEYREQISKLKSYLREVENDENMKLLEKRAEFEALDLAINQRRQQLINLEMTKNRRLKSNDSDNESMASSAVNSNENFLKV